MYYDIVQVFRCNPKVIKILNISTGDSTQPVGTFVILQSHLPLQASFLQANFATKTAIQLRRLLTIIGSYQRYRIVSGNFASRDARVYSEKRDPTDDNGKLSII